MTVTEENEEKAINFETVRGYLETNLYRTTPYHTRDTRHKKHGTRSARKIFLKNDKQKNTFIPNFQQPI